MIEKKLKKQLNREIHQFDAAGKIAGRLASQVAVLLMGKHKATYSPHLDLGDIVEVSNINKLKFSGKKLEQKNYYFPSGYPGGIRKVTLKKFLNEKPEKLFFLMVKRMLPNNKLRTPRLKRLIFI